MQLLARALERLAGLAVRRPGATLAAATAVALAALAAAGLHLELRTSNLDLVDPQLPPVARFRAFAEEFGTPNLLIVVLEGENAGRLAAATDRLGPLLADLPGTLRVLYRLPIDAAIAAPLGLETHFTSRDRGLYFLFVQPDDPYSRAETLAPWVAAVRKQLAAEVPPGQDLAAGGLRAGLTGMPAWRVPRPRNSV